ncbi:lysophospholipid acyltransferase family protein [Microcella pacifica]|uniref:1-acyl-sn-glycerol-3-phosphate acyltransferase n=1 Tax=Microcella pacifica TaxID=2591847 RepID=A0A9E5MEY1_9MICO|nr:lysophospholipid acyltransferase family protein [Microcella pacifica]NHF63032.1 1-acyl-sn-glycerol-3-phosphate acyltransferase [Microcella pacifica]
MFYWLMKNLVVGPIIMTAFRPWVRGIENVPKDGAVILASNHLSFVDSVFLPLVLDRRVVFLAKSDYFTGKGLRGWLTKLFFVGTGQLPIDRSGGKASEASLNTGLRVLADGLALGIYPEGTRSPDGIMYRGRTGVARMILESGAPVVPVAMIDTEKVMPIGTKLPKVMRPGVVFGEPLDFTRFTGLESDRFVLRSVTDEIMYELGRLSGQEYRDVYATSVKDKRPAKDR